MHRFTRNLIVATLAGSLMASVPATLLAQEKKDDRKTKQTVAMSQQVYEKLQEIQELVEAKDYASAQRLVDEAKANEKLSPYERAQVWNLQAYSFYLQERYPDAIRAYEQVLAQPDLPEALIQSSLKTKAQLQFTQEDYEGALATVRQLMSSIEEPAADVYMLEGQALFQLTRYDDALEPIKKAIQMYQEQGQTPKENWLLLLRAIYLEKRDYENMLVVLRQLIEYYPKDTYVLTLAAVLGELGETKKQLALIESLYEKGLIDGRPTYLSNLANLYLMHGVPYKAAQLLEKELANKSMESDERNLRLLSQAWYQAREDAKAIPPLVEAAKLTNEGELYVRIAQAHLNLENWKEAAEAARKGIELGGLDRPDTANIMLGMALFNDKKLERARTAFERAAQDSRSSRAAGQWIKYVDSEIQRRDLLAQDVTYKEREKDEFEEALQGNPDG